MSFASISIVGRLARDPETRMTQTGKQIVSGSVAVGTGDKTQWFKIVAWEKTGEWFKDAKKGDLVFAQGSLQLGTYERKTGGTAIEASVNAQVVRTSHKKQEEQSESIKQAFGSAPVQSDFDLDVPF